MLKVGDYVKFKNDSKSHMGVVIKTIGSVASVFVKHPRTYTIDIFSHLLEKVSYETYSNYLDNKETTGNYFIDNFNNQFKSLEQVIEEFRYEDEFGDVGGWYDYIEAREEFLCGLLEEEEEEFKEHNEFWNLTEEDFKRHSDTTHLNAEEHEDLNKMYIELALLTNDEKWFDELTNKK